MTFFIDVLKYILLIDNSFLLQLYRWGFSKCQTHSKSGLPAYKHEVSTDCIESAMTAMAWIYSDNLTSDISLFT